MSWSGGSGDDNTWHEELVDLAGYLGQPDFRLRFVTRADKRDEHVHVDDLIVTAVLADCPGGEEPDCAGVCGGTAVEDCAGVCDGTAVEDCAGVCDGSAVEDCAGVCGGGATNDCNGVCGGSAVEDCAGVCNGSAVEDCAGVCNGSAVHDCAGVCDGSAVHDCAGVCNGSAVADCAGVCGGSASVDCAGVCDGGAVYDECGVCDGDGTTCTGDTVTFSKAEYNVRRDRLEVRAVSSEEPDVTLWLSYTVDGVPQGPFAMQYKKGRYEIKVTGYGMPDGNLVTVTSSGGGSATTTVQLR